MESSFAAKMNNLAVATCKIYYLFGIIYLIGKQIYQNARFAQCFEIRYHSKFVD